MPAESPHRGAGPLSAPDAWLLRIEGDGPSANAAQAETLLALANGSIGIRGGLEEQPSPTDGAFMAGVYERVPIHYHEAFPGFARASDTRVPVADGKCIRILLGPQAIDLAAGERTGCSRELNLRQGILTRRTEWRAADGARIEVLAERIVCLGDAALMAIRLTLRSIDFSGPVSFESCLAAGEGALRAEDPRIGAGLGAALLVGERRIEEASALMLQSAPHAGIQVATAQTHRPGPGLTLGAASLMAPRGIGQRLQGELVPGARLTLEKFVAWSAGADAAVLGATALRDAARAAASGFEALRRRQQEAWEAFWVGAELGIDGDPALDQALHFSLFHLRQSTPVDGRSALAAKGLTGEGYEGHAFWDTEVFALPVLQMTAPALARASVEFRVRTLDRARRHARELDHAQGALYPWRTIAGDECSSYFLSGSAQYHINAAVAYALRLVQLGTEGPPAASGDAEVLFETARIWMQVGHHSAAHDGAFCIHSVTGPDEYSALVSNDHYTNRMAQLHLQYAAGLAQQLQVDDPVRYTALAERIDLRPDEPASWRRAAASMYLPVDPHLGVHPQDDGFLQRPPWTFAVAPGEERPLLLRYHPLTLYRHQICKQPSVVLADVLAGDAVASAQKRRNFDYYEPLTVHDSSLSASTWSILAAELGLFERALAYFREGARLDLDDLHGNAAHGAHMAAMAGTWLSLVWGFGGLRIGADGRLRLRPVLPAGWTGYHFTLQWRGRRIGVQAGASGVRYELQAGTPIDIVHDGSAVALAPARAVTRPLARIEAARPACAVDAVIFDLDGVLTDTAELHFQAWSRLAQEIGVPFERRDNERLKGVDRARSLELILERAGRSFDAAERSLLAERKNGYFRTLIAALTPAALLPGARDALREVRERGARVALASASHNAASVVLALGLQSAFDFVADPARSGRPKPAPDQFLAAAAALGADPARCIGVEDSVAGIEAIKAAGMMAIGIGDARVLTRADVVVPDIAALGISRFLGAAPVRP